jgi:uracil-DNA glycosylase
VNQSSLLSTLHQEICSCQKCTLKHTCTQVVPGEGSANTSIVFFGEAPGEEEDIEGRPFIGRSGQLLREQMRINGIESAEVYISNAAARCRPPGNREPTPEEMEACWEWTERTLKIIKPRVIVALGRSALIAFSSKLGFSKKVGQNTITKLAGVPIYLAEKDVYIYPMVHPAYACRNSRARADFSGHMKYLKTALPGWYARPEKGAEEGTEEGKEKEQ